jgi:hypothetical protein
VKAYVKRNKNDAADAEAICEAVRRPTMRFVQIESVEQQARLMPHQTSPGPRCDAPAHGPTNSGTAFDLLLRPQS